MDLEKRHEPSAEDILIETEEEKNKSPEELGDLHGFLLSVLQKDNETRKGAHSTEEQIEKRADRMEIILLGLEKGLTLDSIARAIAEKENAGKPVSIDIIRQIYEKFSSAVQRVHSDIDLPDGTFRFKSLLRKLDEADKRK